jgi:hypothetical protein
MADAAALLVGIARVFSGGRKCCYSVLLNNNDSSGPDHDTVVAYARNAILRPKLLLDTGAGRLSQE